MIKLGTRFYDEKNDRYLTVDGVGCDPKCYCCIQEEYNHDTEDLEITDRVLLMEYELKHFAQI